MPLHHLMVVGTGGTLYAIGGEFDGAGTGRPSLFVDTVFALDPAAGEWVARAPMPTGRSAGAAVVLDGKLYVVGGRFGGGFDSELTNVTEVYDPATGLWTAGPPAPTIRSGMSAAVIGHCLYMFGGERNRADPRGVFPQTEALDTRTGTWHELTPMPTPMHGQIGAAVFDGRIHVAGGAVTYGGDSGTVLHQVYTPERACG
jgi:N-acetylneuraminic acid mutarotase